MIEKEIGKRWYKSKILWVNIIAVGAVILSGQFGIEMTPQLEIAILGGINFVLRLITKEEIIWKK